MMANEKSPSGDTAATTPERAPRRRPQSGGRFRDAGADGRRSSETLKRNQERLGVGADHRTESMKKGKRGTFP